MKRNSRWYVAVLAVAGSLAVASSALAQGITVLSDFHNFNLSVTYANWNPDGSLIFNGGEGFPPVITSGATSFEVKALGYGSGAYDFPTPISAPGANQWQLTFTINAPTASQGSFWMNPGLDISDGTHQVHLTAQNAGGGYLNYGSYTAGTYTLYGTLKDQNGGADLDPTTVTAFNLEFDPAAYDASQHGPGTPYDITYQSLVLVTPIPEPATLALFGLGVGGFVLARRRAKAS
jgi:hypothetical protein